MSSPAKIIEAPNAWRKDLVVDDRRHPKRTVANVILMLSRAPEWRNVLAFDAFAERIVTRSSPPWHDEIAGAAPWTEHDDVRLVAHVERELGFSLKAGEIRGAVENIARRRTVNPLVEWLDSLKWDETPRAHEWLSAYLGVTPSEYAGNVGLWFLLGAVARAFKPGCKVDHVLVLEGPQGKRKSTALRTLAGDAFFSDTPIEMGSKDRFITIQGTWIQEIAELDGFDRADVNRTKSYVTSSIDVYRPPYGRGSVRLPRRCVFAATVNGDTYLRDETGNRRFWPVRVGETILLAELARDRDQLWAEALHLYRAGAKWWPDTAAAIEACAAEQVSRVAVDAWQDIVEALLHDRRSVTIGEVLREALSLPAGKWTPADQYRAARCLRAAGWERKQVRDGARRVWVYAPAEGPASGVTSYNPNVTTSSRGGDGGNP